VAEAGGDPTKLGTADLRRLWPQILENVKNRRRFTWILLSQNAQVVEARGDVLTIGLANPGARDSFGKGGSTEVLREAILEVIGAAMQIETIVDATAEAAAAAGPAQPVAPPAQPKRSAAAKEAAKEAKASIRPTRSGADAESVAEPEAEPDRNDAEVAEDGASSEELLMKHLGAELIDPS
jgi:DNA polymerase-3 subunit gamma/tau